MPIATATRDDDDDREEEKVVRCNNNNKQQQEDELRIICSSITRKLTLYDANNTTTGRNIKIIKEEED